MRGAGFAGGGRVRLLVLCTSPGLGGLELYAEREWQHLTAAGWSCHFAIARRGRLAQRNAQQGRNVLLLPQGDGLLPLAAARRLARYIDSQGIDVMHMHWGRELRLAALATRLSRRRPKLVYSRHMGITRPKKDLLHRFLYRQVDRLLAISKQVQREARRFLPLAEEQIRLLYLGVADRSVTGSDCEPVPGTIRQRPFRIALFGRIEHGKGQHVLIEALQQFIGTGREAGALLVGQIMDARYFEKLQEQIGAAGLSGHVERRDFLDNPMAVMPCFDVVVLTTLCETFGLVLVEAMRAGVAVIGTDAGGVPEIIEHEKSGLLVPPGDAAALASALVRLYDDPALKQRLAAAGKARADQMFDSGRHFQRLEAELESL